MVASMSLFVSTTVASVHFAVASMTVVEQTIVINPDRDLRKPA